MSWAEMSVWPKSLTPKCVFGQNNCGQKGCLTKISVAQMGFWHEMLVEKLCIWSKCLWLKCVFGLIVWAQMCKAQNLQKECSLIMYVAQMCHSCCNTSKCPYFHSTKLLLRVWDPFSEIVLLFTKLGQSPQITYKGTMTNIFRLLCISLR